MIIDYNLLHKQKLTLVSLMLGDKLSETEKLDIEGIVNVIDSIQDDAVKAELWQFPEDESMDNSPGTISPLPWACNDCDISSAHPEADEFIANTAGREIGAAFFSDVPRRCEANAAYIVRAANAYPKLVAALQRLADASASVGNLDHAGMPVPAETWAEMYAANNQARAALAEYSEGI